MPSRISPETFPIAATATAPAYDYEPAPEPRVWEAGQAQLFPSEAAKPRVVPFDSLTSPAERESIRARAEAHRPFDARRGRSETTEITRPAPVKTARVEVRHAKPRKTKSLDQRTLDFQGQQEVLSPPQSNIICDAPVAPAALRVEAAFLDGLLIALGYALAGGLFLYLGGHISADRHSAPFLLMALVTLPLVYKLLWTAAGHDSIGMQKAGIRLVDFDGNPPSQRRRFQRLAGSILSLLAAGVGLIWALLDQDGLTWHDHISSTFPTIDSDSR